MVKWSGAFVPIFYTFYIVAVAVGAEMAISDEHGKGVQFLKWGIPVLTFLFLPVLSYYSVLLSDIWFFSRKKYRAVFRRNGEDFKRMGLRRTELVKKTRAFVEDNIGENTYRVAGDGAGGEGEVVGGVGNPMSGSKVYPESVGVEGVNSGNVKG